VCSLEDLHDCLGALSRIPGDLTKVLLLSMISLVSFAMGTVHAHDTGRGHSALGSATEYS
jgi:hypothetical protein